MKKVNNRIIKGVLCLVTLSTMLIGQNNILTKGYAQDTYSEVAGESHTGSFSVDSLTLQPGATTTSINLNWYAPAGTTVAKIQFGDQTYDVTAKPLTSPTEIKSDKYTDTGKLVCKTTISNLKPDTKYTYYISNDGGTTWSKEYNYTTPSSNEFTLVLQAIHNKGKQGN